ncbi:MULTISPECIES: type II toxin-antitoxin system RelE/ParE family toxin [unclassified Thioalkalivibrio]|uniref:type II toxin-antitoxin system RelE family toxin n=1 Tax=unclassified Thioalkalivibrio TaxID=2621013 RepID=UPI00036AA343|nr:MULTISPECIES: type II toxin-antitoxin system RelE/ParE family toxin [unclassified Thioalkalivibrio]
MSWTIEFDKRVEKDLRALDKQAARRILEYLNERIASLDDPRRLGKSLSGELGEYWRYRIGPYRVIASIEDDRLRVLVVRVAHRNTVYRQGKV